MRMNYEFLLDDPLDEVLNYIYKTSKKDVVVELNKIKLLAANTGETGVSAEFEGLTLPIRKIALSQLESAILPGFSVFGKCLRNKGMYDLYIDNANKLLRQIKDKKMMVRIIARPSDDMSIRAFLSTSYQPYDDNIVFEAMQDVIQNTKEAVDFQCIGGRCTDSTSYIKFVTKKPLFSIMADSRTRYFSPGFILSNSEIGQGYCRLDVLLIDCFCTNGCIFSYENYGKVKILHRGRNLSGLASGTIIGPEQGTKSIVKIQSAIRSALKTAFNERLYLPYKDVLQNAAKVKIKEKSVYDLDLYVNQIGKIYDLTESENKGISERLSKTGDRSLFGIQAALTDAAKYVKDHDRKLELERIAGKIVTDIPQQWEIIQKFVDAERSKL